MWGWESLLAMVPHWAPLICCDEMCINEQNINIKNINIRYEL